MDREQLFNHISQLENDLQNMQENLESIKVHAVKLVEENVSLQMEKEHYETLVNNAKTKPDASFKQNTLKNLYEEGFHICNVHFGTHRHGEECLFCQGFINQR